MFASLRTGGKSKRPFVSPHWTETGHSHCGIKAMLKLMQKKWRIHKFGSLFHQKNYKSAGLKSQNKTTQVKKLNCLTQTTF